MEKLKVRKWETLSKAEAQECFDNLDVDNIHIHDSNIHKLRETLVSAYNEFLKENSVEALKGYKFDLHFGLILYDNLSDIGFGFYEANNIEIWIYLSMKIIPDIVQARWGKNPERFYTNPRRIWLKTLWWYIHLSLQLKKENGRTTIDYESTYSVLQNNTTDEIVQLVERAGSDGYRLDVSRKIMKRYSLGNTKSTRGLFRKVMKLNTVRLNSMEPALCEGGVKGYVNELFNFFEDKK